MIKIALGLTLLLTAGFAFSQPGNWSKEVKEMIDQIDEYEQDYADLAHQIWNLAELGFLEEESVKLLSKPLRENGFTI